MIITSSHMNSYRCYCIQISSKTSKCFYQHWKLLKLYVFVYRGMCHHTLWMDRFGHDLWSSHLLLCLLRFLKCPKKYPYSKVFLRKTVTFFGHICESVKQKVFSIWVKWKMFPVMNIFSRRLNFIVFHITKK